MLYRSMHLSVVVTLAFSFGCPEHGVRRKVDRDFTESRELGDALHNAKTHYKIDPHAMIEFVVEQEPERASGSVPDANEAMVWLLGARSMVHVYDTGQEGYFFHFDRQHLKDLDGDRWLEYYSRSQRRFDVDEKGKVALRPEK